MRRDPFRDEPIFAMRDMTRIGESAPDCFEDEIAIDFPSIGGLVDRVRGRVPGRRCARARGNGDARGPVVES
ncbi:MAG: hypothetical protein QM736_11060 [Vicinamibacterales bacterium]